MRWMRFLRLFQRARAFFCVCFNAYVRWLIDSLNNAPTNYIRWTNANFTYDSNNKIFVSNEALPISIDAIKTAFVYPTNGAAVLGIYIRSNSYVVVAGITPSTAASIDNAYNFRIVFGY